MATITQTTLLDLVQTVNAFAASEAEVVATVAYLINSGKVRLCGNFAGAKIDLAGPITLLRIDVCTLRLRPEKRRTSPHDKLR